MTKPVPLGSEAHLAKKYELGGMMNAEEARMNKALLHEIARKRVGDQGSPESKSRCWYNVIVFSLSINVLFFKTNICN